MTRGELAGAWLADRLPLAMQSRLAVGGRELGLIALVGALGLCVVSILALRSSAAAATPVHRGNAVVAPQAAASSSRPLVAAVRSGAGTVMVDVAGAVAHPGIVTLPSGARVFQAIKAAGGAQRGVDMTSVNLARVVTDGEQIVVGRGSGASAAGGDHASSVVSLNHATESELDALPGVGPVTAKSIVAWRSHHGAFTRVEELEEIDGIGPKTFAKLKPLVGL